VTAKEARLVVTKTALWAGQTRAVVGDLALFTDDTSVSRIRLAWTATGDDGTKGTATSYDVRRGPSALDDSSFASATPVAGMTVPKAAGSLERFEITGLPAETQLCFGVQATDDVGLTSGVSNSACAKTPGLPPATVVDLRVESVTGTTATLVWTAPGDDGASGTAASYDLRMAPVGTHLSTANWATVTAVAGVPAPKVAGSTERFTVSGLSGNTTYVFALRTTDKAAQTSGVSNNLAVTTGDNVPPSKVTDLAALTDLTQSGTLTITFTATGDNGALGTAKSYDLRVSLNPIDDANFANAAMAGTPAPQAAGAKESIRVNGLGAETSYYLALRVTDAAGNVSATSNIATGTTRQEPPSVAERPDRRQLRHRHRRHRRARAQPLGLIAASHRDGLGPGPGGVRRADHLRRPQQCLGLVQCPEGHSGGSDRAGTGDRPGRHHRQHRRHGQRHLHGAWR
jgi:hypothetical protein